MGIMETDMGICVVFLGLSPLNTCRLSQEAQWPSENEQSPSFLLDVYFSGRVALG